MSGRDSARIYMPPTRQLVGNKTGKELVNNVRESLPPIVSIKVETRGVSAVEIFLRLLDEGFTRGH